MLYRNIFCTICRGVFQTLVEKHFPAPDRRKFFDIFGLSGGSYNEDSNPPTPGSNKRKKGQCLKNFSVDFLPISFNICIGAQKKRLIIIIIFGAFRLKFANKMQESPDHNV